jgi:hypothetical protein
MFLLSLFFIIEQRSFMFLFVHEFSFLNQTPFFTGKIFCLSKLYLNKKPLLKCPNIPKIIKNIQKIKTRIKKNIFGTLDGSLNGFSINFQVK